MDEQIYTKALEEFDSDLRNKDLWIKALTLCNWDEKSAKYTYIKLYVEKASVQINIQDITDKTDEISTTRIKKKSIENNKKSSVSRFYAPQPAKAMADKLQHASDVIQKEFYIYKCDYEAIVKGKSIYDKILYECFEENFLLFNRLLIVGDNNGIFQYCPDENKRKKLLINLEKFFNLKGKSIDILKRNKDVKSEIVITDNLKQSKKTGKTSNNDVNKGKETHTWKYILAWILFGIISSFTNNILGMIFSLDVYNNTIFWQPIVNSISSLFIAIIIYSSFSTLKINRVVPWMWVLGGVGLVLSYFYTKELYNTLNLKLPISFWISVIIGYLGFVLGFTEYFKQYKSKQYYD